MADSFVSLAEPAEHEIVIKRSRFICHLIPVRSPEEAEEAIAAIRREHYDARHNCPAMIIGERGEYEKASDDGEPQGTAGVPMLEVLRRSGVTNILAVVTRYFGGTLLGAGGLVRAYSGSVAEALREAKLVRNVPAVKLEVRLPYADYGKLQNIARTFDASLEADFGADVTAEVTIREERSAAFLARMQEALLGALHAEQKGTCLLEEPVG
ncbi:MAG: YigZ family protein [Clostridia bacterium]|nr:YigZ family protein [Clostridia bacterium]